MLNALYCDELLYADYTDLIISIIAIFKKISNFVCYGKLL